MGQTYVVLGKCIKIQYICIQSDMKYIVWFNDMYGGLITLSVAFLFLLL